MKKSNDENSTTQNDSRKPHAIANNHSLGAVAAYYADQNRETLREHQRTMRELRHQIHDRAKTRKRGETLDQEIFAAALACVESFGLARTTFAKIALLARTGRSVLYRRYATPTELIIDAFLDHVRKTKGGSILNLDFDRGNLRDSLLAMFNNFTKFDTSLTPEFSKLLLGEFANNASPHAVELIERAHRGNLAVINKVLAAAKQRGEIAHEPSDMVKSLPFDILRFKLLSDYKNVTPKFIEQLVDEVLLPALVKK